MLRVYGTKGSLRAWTPPPARPHAVHGRRAVHARAEGVEALPSNLRNIVNAFKMVPDPMARYKQLLFFAAKLKGLGPDQKVDANKVRGCVSQVWVVPEVKDDKIFWQADSDAQLTKGLAALLVQGLSGSEPREVANIDPEFIELLGLKQSLTPSRNNGFLNMFRLMQAQALAAMSDAANIPDAAHADEADAAGAASTSNGSGTAAAEASPSTPESSAANSSSSDARPQTSPQDAAPSTSGSSKWEPTESCAKPVAASIVRKMEALGATDVRVVDDSASHAGHSGARDTVSPSGETHLKVRVIADAFEGLNTVKRHRLVFAELAEELAGPVHALNVETKTPAEVAAAGVS